MNRSIFFKVILGVVLVGALIGLSFYAYQVGFSNGLVQSAQVESGSAPAPVYPMYAFPYARPFFGFGVRGCLRPRSRLFRFFFAMRGLFWYGPRRWGGMHRGPWSRHADWPEGFPPVVEEWHRKMHAKEDDQTPSQQV